MYEHFEWDFYFWNLSRIGGGLLSSMKQILNGQKYNWSCTIDAVDLNINVDDMKYTQDQNLHQFQTPRAAKKIITRLHLDQDILFFVVFPVHFVVLRCL